MKQMINVALPKGRLGEKAYGIFERAGFECPSIKEENRKLIFENPEKELYLTALLFRHFPVPTVLFFYLIPSCNITHIDALYLIFGKLFDWIVIVYNYRNTVFCDNSCCKSSVNFCIF